MSTVSWSYSDSQATTKRAHSPASIPWILFNFFSAVLQIAVIVAILL